MSAKVLRWWQVGSHGTSERTVAVSSHLSLNDKHDMSPSSPHVFFSHVSTRALLSLREEVCSSTVKKHANGYAYVT